MNSSLSEMLARPCAADHFGLWMIEPRWMSIAESAIRQGQWKATPSQASRHAAEEKPSEKKLPKTVYYGFDSMGDPRPLYSVDAKGVAWHSIHGHMTKGDSSFGGTSTTRMRLAVRHSYDDTDVRGLMVMIESPGGTAAGTPQLADDIYRLARDGRKPVHVHAEDVIASAAYYAGSQASRLTVNATAEVGSIGTVALIEDSSGAAEQAGFKVHLLSTGPYKGAFAPGVPVTEEHLDYARERVDAVTEPFLQAIKRGRRMGIDAARELAYGPEGGKVWSAPRAMELGLVDAIESDEVAYSKLLQAIRETESARQSDSDNRRRRIQLAEMS
jgi:signal peptide peptidase SppA